MLKFIKKLFAKEKTNGGAREEGITIYSLNEWLDVKAKPIFEELNGKISEIANKLNDEKQEALNNLKELESAKLQNPKIPEMAKIMMEGNRAAFIRKTAFFFKDTSLEHANYDELTKKCGEIETEINSLGKSTARSYMVLNEFFSHEVEKVAANIKNIETYAKDAKTAVSSSKISKIAEIKSNIKDVQKKIKLKETYSEELKNEKISLENIKNKKSELEHRIKEIKSGKGYKGYEKMLEEISSIESEIKNIDSKLFHDFSALERALKKYAKIAFEDEKLIAAYLDNPINALINDNTLEISRIITGMEKAISENKFELEQKKSDKTIAQIRELGQNYFEDLQDNHKRLDKKLISLRQLAKDDLAQNELERLNNELKNIENAIGNINGKILELSDDLEKIDMVQLKENLQNDIKEIVNEDIAIP